ncbi:MAG: PD-(D/E)XK nuclease family protein, partial [bacterium]
PLHRLSYSALRTFRDCPYRFLLERGFGLRQEEEVIDEFRRLDYGNLVHDCLRLWLTPDGDGAVALARNDGSAALTALEQIAALVFGEGAEELPQRRLWQETFLELAPNLVEFELARFQTGWRPRVLEGGFQLDLTRLARWLVDHPDLAPSVSVTEQLPDIPPDARRVRLVGKIDRIDLMPVSGAPVRSAAVFDYKTGQVPTAAAVRDGRELQIALYVLATEIGSVADLPDAAGCRVTEGVYYRLKAGECGYRPGKPQLDSASDSGRRVLWDSGRIILLAALAARDTSLPVPLVPELWQDATAGPLPCRWCAFDAVCRLEERIVPIHLEARLSKEQSLVRQW